MFTPTELPQITKSKTARFSLATNQRYLPQISPISHFLNNKQLTGTLPRRGIVNDGAVQSDHILPTRYERSPPRILDILLKFGTERSIVEEPGESIVNFRRGEDDAPPLAERHDVVHLELGVGLGIGHDGGRGWLFGFGLLGG